MSFVLFLQTDPIERTFLARGATMSCFATSAASFASTSLYGSSSSRFRLVKIIDDAIKTEMNRIGFGGGMRLRRATALETFAIRTAGSSGNCGSRGRWRMDDRSLVGVRSLLFRYYFLFDRLRFATRCGLALLLLVVACGGSGMFIAAAAAAAAACATIQTTRHRIVVIRRRWRRWLRRSSLGCRSRKSNTIMVFVIMSVVGTYIHLHGTIHN